LDPEREGVCLNPRRRAPNKQQQYDRENPSLKRIHNISTGSAIVTETQSPVSTGIGPVYVTLQVGAHVYHPALAEFPQLTCEINQNRKNLKAQDSHQCNQLCDHVTGASNTLLVDESRT
jgi:hypothetical protein